MTLNKSTGLYSMPSHHLHGAHTIPLPSFNSMDFAIDSPDPPKTKRGPGRPRKDSQPASIPQEKTDKKNKKRLSMSKQEPQETSSRTPVAPTPIIKFTPATASTKGKKRKRESGGQVPQRRSSFVGENMLQNVQSAVKAAREVFSDPSATAQRVEEPSKKKAKKYKASRKSTDTVDFDLMAKETRRIAKKEKKEKKARRRSTGNVQTGPLPPAPVSRSLPPIFSAPPRKTPVPLPPNAFSHANNASKANRIGSRDASFLVVETPDPQLPKTPADLPDSPIPFKLTDVIKAKKSKKSKKAVDSSPPTPVVSEAPSSAPPALDKHRKLELKADGRVSLTSSNLLKYTSTSQPLSDAPKPRPRAFSRAASTAGSTTSGGTAPSIRDLFAHVGKPYSRSGAEVDPFVAPEVKKKIPRETHDEAPAEEFSQRYKAAQNTVNFSDEAEYLAAFLAWRAANSAQGPLPCLGIKASGCSTKKEAVLRQTQSDTRTEPSPTALAAAAHRGHAAESLLAHAVRARIPVPLGALAGLWTLFCPPYSAAHIDKYGSGQRTLLLSPVAGGPPTSFTARLSIPPRSMLYAIRPFDVPPHAGFRATILRTSVEGYGMEVVFLGNGYLILRVDLRLLLSGKEGRTEGGEKVVMEFVGVHEKAVVWEEEEDEVEALGKKLFAKYDGEA